MLVNGGLNPDVFCVTDSFQYAADFYARKQGGVIAIRNSEILELHRRLCRYQDLKLALTNCVYDDNEDHYQKHVAELRECNRLYIDLPKAFEDIIERIRPGCKLETGQTNYSFLQDSVDQFGWGDPAHVDSNDFIAMLYGKARPTEIATEHTLQSFNDFKPFPNNNAKVKKLWKDNFFQPMSFLPGFLVILCLKDDNSSGPIHCLPRRLARNEDRSSILTKRF